MSVIFFSKKKRIESLEIKLQETKNQLAEMQAKNNALLENISQLERYKEDFAQIKLEYDNLKEKNELELQQAVNQKIEELGISKKKFAQLMADREELIAFYIDKLYSLAQRFALESKESGENRGLFIILVDERNFDDSNFSVFHEGQIEYLNQECYIGLDQIPHIFSPVIKEVFTFMGEKVESIDRDGKVIGYDERDGALLVNLKGVAFMSRIMVEGVRTHKVYDKVEPLLEGNAKHNAALYASSLDEVMAVIVISEETSKVTIFRDGKFVKSYDAYADIEKTRPELFGDEEKKKAKVVHMKKPIAIDDSETEETLSKEVQPDSQVSTSVEHPAYKEPIPPQSSGGSQ
jgi:hypothetical protein